MDAGPGVGCCELPCERTWGHLVPEELPFLEQVQVCGGVEVVNTGVSSTWLPSLPKVLGTVGWWLEKAWIWAQGAAQWCVVLMMGLGPTPGPGVCWGQHPQGLGVCLGGGSPVPGCCSAGFSEPAASCPRVTH